MKNARPLFVAGCQRSGTTAFAEYLNRHPEVLVCLERYGRIPAEEVNPDLFTFERILDYGKEETTRPRGYYEKLLGGKDPERLRWVGDKYPGYARWLRRLDANNPGARFIVLYRPVEEVAESWEARSRNPEDPWLGGKDGFELGVKTWNNIQNRTRKFIEGGLGERILLVSYRDFFYRNEACVPLISAFLGIEFDARVREDWRRMSEAFERERRPKEPLTTEQEEYVRLHKDREAGAWIEARIERQWRRLESGEPVTGDGSKGDRAVEPESTKGSRARKVAQRLNRLRAGVLGKLRPR